MGHKKVARILVATIAGLSMQAAFAINPVFTFIDMPQGILIDAPNPVSIPAPPVPPGSGVHSYMQSQLLDTRGNVVGKQYGVCATVNASGTIGNEAASEIRMCNQTMIINGYGTLQLMGLLSTTLFDAHISQPLAIVGGTGAFQFARGQVLTTEPVEHTHGFAVYLTPY